MKLNFLLGICSLAFLSGCGEDKADPAISYFPNMHQQPSVYAQEAAPFNKEIHEEGELTGRAARVPVSGTLPTHFTPYEVKMNDVAAAKKLRNPLRPTMDILKAGRRNYNIYCVVCHGETGDGLGSIIPNAEREGYLIGGRKTNSNYQMATPPALFTDKIKGWSDGEIFNYVTHGGATMPSYRHLAPEMRWAIVHYVRVLYKAANPSSDELKEYRANKGSYVDKSPSKIVQWKNK